MRRPRGFAVFLLLVSAAAGAQPPGTDVYLAALTGSGERLAAGPAAALAPEPGYDNQPFFLPDNSGLLFTSDRAAEATEIFRYVFATSELVRLTDTVEAEYSPTPIEGGFSVVRVEADGTQRLWRFDAEGANPRLLLPEVRGVGYHAWADADRVALFVLGQPPTLELASLASGQARRLLGPVGRALHRIPSGGVSFVAPRAGGAAEELWVQRLDPATGSIEPIAPVLATAGEHDLAWTPDGTLLMADGAVVHRWDRPAAAWKPLRDFAGDGLARVSRLAVSPGGDRLALVAADASGPGWAERAAEGRAQVAAAEEAATGGHWTLARRQLERAARLLPAQRGIERRLAGALAREGRKEQAFERLRRLERWQVPIDLRTEANLEPLRSDPGFAALADTMAAVAPRSRSQLAARFPAEYADFVPEGVAEDPASGRLFVSSVRQGTIAVVRDGEVRPFADLKPAGFGHSVLGLATDPARGLLWAVVAGLPQGAAIPPSVIGRTALCALDLESGRLRRCVPPPSAAPGEHAFNDLVVGGEGVVYVSDPGAAAVYRLPPGASGLEPVLDRRDVVSPNGLALSVRGDVLYVADYSLGLLRLDLSGAGSPPRRLETPEATLVGIDGLVRWRTSLLVIQNGVAPPRILRLALGESGESIESAEILEIARPEWDEPTLGVEVRGELVYVGNSHWPRFAEDGSLPGAAELEPPVLFRLRPGAY
jgi:hypothetical protein